MKIKNLPKLFLVILTAWLSLTFTVGAFGLNFSEEQDTFEQAKADGLVDDSTYAAFITAAGNTGHFEAARIAFEEASDKDFNDVLTCHSYIDVLMQSGDITRAVKLFKKIHPRYAEEFITEDRMYDFHGFSFVSAYIASHVLASRMSPGEEVSVIVGIGKQSEEIIKGVELFVEQINEAVTLIRDDSRPWMIRLLRLNQEYQPNRVLNTKFIYRLTPPPKESHWKADNQLEDMATFINNHGYVMHGLNPNGLNPNGYDPEHIELLMKKPLNIKK